MSTVYNVIRVKCYSTHQEEGIATVATTPGMLVRRHTNETSWRPHNVAGAVCAKSIALEDSMQGNEIDDDYAIGDPVHIHHALPGDIVNMLLTTNQTIVVDDLLVSTGDGTLKKATAEVGLQIVGKAIQALDTTDSLITTPQRILVQII